MCQVRNHFNWCSDVPIRHRVKSIWGYIYITRVKYFDQNLSVDILVKKGDVAFPARLPSHASQNSDRPYTFPCILRMSHLSASEH